GLLLMAGIAVAPYVLPGNAAATDKLIVSLRGLSEIVPTALLLCSLAIGMTVINHDLDSGAVVSIFAKPVSRESYTAGKLLAALSLVLLIAAIFAAGSMIVLAIDGGQAYNVVFWECAVLAANAVLLMLLVMALTVYVNNVIAGAIVLAFNFVASRVLDLHAMVVNGTITNHTFTAIANAVYWVVPHELTSNLQRTILQLRLDSHELVVRGFDPFKDVPGASSTVDIAFWLGYVILICALLFFAMRRKQV
ncbi:MAG TPA: ABC transporter permease subunit, partial [Candidatus Dormibacteraeota bacterium]|nr:ABC transporter permease subunit [Candidatus Dormibacteraeota bacterium]